MFRSAAVMALLVAPIGAKAQNSAASELSSAPAAGPAYADLARLVLVSPVIADVTIRSATRIKGPEAANVAPGQTRFYVEADVGALVRGTAGLPQRIGYVIDVAPDSRGRPPRLRKQRVVIFARPVATAGDQVQLVGPDAQQSWSPDLERRVRAIATEVVARDAPPAITGVGNAFHVAGALPGEGETQIFLHTADNRPVSLSILRRPGEQPRWSVALAEIVDEAAAAPARDTLLWYRLACGLPATLPAASTASLEAADATVAQADYRLVIDALGPCGARDARVSGGDGPA